MSHNLAWNPGPKPPMDVYLAWGDSMCDGRGDIADAPDGYEPASGLWMVKTAAAGYAALAEPCGQAAGASAGVGPWGLFGWLASLETGRDTCIVNAGVGSSLTSAWVPGQTNYNNALGRLQRAMSRRETTLRGILVYIGPNDSAGVPEPDWLGNVQSTLSGVRTWAGKTAAQLPCIYVRLAASDSGTWAATVRADQDALEDANHLMVTPPSPPDLDGVHHKTGQNYTIAQAALALAMGHASWA